MDHIKSSFYFKSKDDIWQVDYQENPGEWDMNMTSQVYLNDELYHEFDRLPSTNTSNPTKSQAKEIISAAKKINKLSDKRDKKIKKILS